jgi:hypothetical protein
MPKVGGVVRQLLTMAFIVIPWFFRDQYATTLDEQAREAQQVLSEKGDHEQRQQQNSSTREVMRLLARIDLNQRKSVETTPDEIDAEEARLWSNDSKDNGKALEDDVKAFDGLLPRVSLGDDQNKMREMEGIATNADAVAKKLEVFELTAGGMDNTRQAIKLQGDFEQADIRLREAWKDLEVAAQKDQEDASAAAKTSRIIAWVCTAIGAAMAGGLKKFLGGFFGGAD